MLSFLIWLLLLFLCWPIAILALILYPVFWLILLPFRHRRRCRVQPAARDRHAAGARARPPPRSLMTLFECGSINRRQQIILLLLSSRFHPESGH